MRIYNVIKENSFGAKLLQALKYVKPDHLSKKIRISLI